MWFVIPQEALKGSLGDRPCHLHRPHLRHETIEMHCTMVNSDQGGRGRTASSKMHKSTERARMECIQGVRVLVQTQTGGPAAASKEDRAQALIPVPVVPNSRANLGRLHPIYTNATSL